MKRIFIYITVLLLGSLVWSCTEDKLNPNSVFVDPAQPKTPFDNYLYREFTVPYNIEVKYVLDDKETDQEHVLVPAKIESAKVMSVLLKHLWLDVYNEVAAERVIFTRQFAAHVILLVGSGSYNTDGTVTLGEAAGGKKITLFDINTLNPSNKASLSATFLLNEDGYFHTIHHEFAHILHQTKLYPDSFQQISVGDYLGDLGWTDIDDAAALNMGFITNYGSKNPDEDFVEIISMYIIMTEAQWNQRIARANAAGKAKLAEKLELVKGYLSASWGIDLDNLRSVVLRRANEVENFEDKDFVDLK